MDGIYSHRTEEGHIVLQDANDVEYEQILLNASDVREVGLRNGIPVNVPNLTEWLDVSLESLGYRESAVLPELEVVSGYAVCTAENGSQEGGFLQARN